MEQRAERFASGSGVVARGNERREGVLEGEDLGFDEAGAGVGVDVVVEEGYEDADVVGGGDNEGGSPLVRVLYSYPHYVPSSHPTTTTITITTHAHHSHTLTLYDCLCVFKTQKAHNSNPAIYNMTLCFLFFSSIYDSLFP